MLSMATDYAADTGSPEPALRAIGRAGFSHVHWCHQWCTDFLYSKPEIEQIARWLGDFGLKVIDLHGSDGTGETLDVRRGVRAPGGAGAGATTASR